MTVIDPDTAPAGPAPGAHRPAAGPASSIAREAAAWNHHPGKPVEIAPYFDWPPRPRALLAWLAASWLTVSMTVIELALAVAVYVWLQPATEVMQTLAPGWIAQIWARNIALMLIVAGGLHLYFHTYRKQGRRLKFDKRELAARSGQFTFSSQVLDNMFWSLASGVTVWTAWEVLYFWCAANGWVPGASLVGNPVWFVAFFFVIPVWSSLHFYWVHRLLHWPPLYRIAHALHHRNVNVGPWSGISMHPVEHLLFYTNFAIHFVVPTHPVHFLFHAYYQSLGPAASHSGFEALEVKGEKAVELGTFYHQLHHRYFECNYGTMEMPWDRWFGTFHDGSSEATDTVKERRRRMMGG